MADLGVSEAVGVAGVVPDAPRRSLADSHRGRGVMRASLFRLSSLLLVAVVLAALWPAAVQARTTAWTATLTVGANGEYLGCEEPTPKCSDQLTSTAVSIGEHSNGIWFISLTADFLTLGFTAEPSASLEALTFCVGEVGYPLSDATKSTDRNTDDTWRWAGTTGRSLPSWNVGDSVELKLASSCASAYTLSLDIANSVLTVDEGDGGLTQATIRFTVTPTLAGTDDSFKVFFIARHAPATIYRAGYGTGQCPWGEGRCEYQNPHTCGAATASESVDYYAPWMPYRYLTFDRRGVVNGNEIAHGNGRAGVIDIIGDDQVESDETFEVCFFKVDAGDDSFVIDNSLRRVTITITNDDPQIEGNSCDGCGSEGELGVLTPPQQQPVNRAPTVAAALADQSGLTAGTSRQVSLAGVFSDPDGDSLTVTAGSDNETAATVAVVADFSSLTITGVSAGTATITVVAQDPHGERVLDDFDVTVQAANEPDTTTGLSGTAARYDTDNNGAIDLAEYRQAVYDYIAKRITYTEMLEVVNAYLSS